MEFLPGGDLMTLLMKKVIASQTTNDDDDDAGSDDAADAMQTGSSHENKYACALGQSDNQLGDKQNCDNQLSCDIQFS